MLLKQSNSENKIKKKKSKKHENKRKRSGSANKINQNNKNQETFLQNKHNSLDEKKSSIQKSHNGNSSEELENVVINVSNRQEKFDSSDENCRKNKIKNFKNKNINNNIINFHNESTEEMNSSNHDNTTDKIFNEFSSDESLANKKGNSKMKINSVENDTVLTVRNMENDNEYTSGSNTLGIQTKAYNVNINNNNQVTNKMSWRKMTKGNFINN